MPPAPVWAVDGCLLRGSVGNARVADALFLNSLTGDGVMWAAATFWLALVIPHCLSSVSSPAGMYDVSMRLMIYVFLGAMILADDLDRLPLPYFPLPSAFAKLIFRLVKAGMPGEKLKDARAARALVLVYAGKLTSDKRTFARADFVSVNLTSPCYLSLITAQALRGGAPDNERVATFLLCLHDWMTTAEEASPSFQSMLDMLLPETLAGTASLGIKALKATAHIRSTTPDPPLDMYVVYQENLFDLSRRQDDMQGRFAPLFEKHRHEVFQAAVAAFPQAVNAAALRQKLAALALSIGVTFQFSHEGVEAICMLIAPQLTSLEIEAPAATSSDDDRFGALVVLHKSQPGGRPAPSTSADGTKSDAGEDMKLLLSNKSYTSLYAEILALNNSAFNSSAPVITVSQHESAVGMVLMTTKRSISQPAWSKVISMRQHSAWYTAVDKVLARDSDGNEQPNWGRMITSPTGDEAHAVVVLLFMHKFDEIKDWLALCRKYITKTEGAAVLLDPVYTVGTDPLDFWLNEDLLRLCEDPLKIVFKLLSHGQSRSVAGSFNAFLSFQILRAQKLKRVPHNLKVYPTLLSKAKAALRVTFTTNAEHAAGLRTVPFHAMERTLWVPPGGSAALAFEDVDKQLVSVREELAKAEDGEAVHQAPHLQPITGQSVSVPVACPRSAAVAFGSHTCGTAGRGRGHSHRSDCTGS